MTVKKFEFYIALDPFIVKTFKQWVENGENARKTEKKQRRKLFT